MPALWQRLLGWAAELGFSQIGVADVDLSNAEPGLLAWLDAGCHGDMGYMAAHGVRRARPAELVPGTVRVITARMDYLPRSTPEGWQALAFERLGDPQAAGVSLYALGRDYHKVLRQRLQALAATKPAATQLLVLHMLGNHGPSYFRRYPPAFRRFLPPCEFDDLQKCSREQIVNAYDNALLYTDHVLAQAIAWLRQDSTAHDTALIYVSDHGESLGDNGLYLHGVPQAIAPAVQTQVPMVVWLSQGLVKQQGIDLACLRQRSTQAASHDNLFHSLLGLMGVGTALYERSLDVLADCRH